jgi:SAM-dependent methyltransferase
MLGLSIRQEIVEEVLETHGARVGAVLEAARRAKTPATRRKRWHTYEDAVDTVLRAYERQSVDRPDATLFHRAFVLWDSLGKTGEPEDLDLACTPIHVRRRIIEQLAVAGDSLGLYAGVARDIGAVVRGGRVLEVGCGGAELAEMLARDAGCAVIATDIDDTNFPVQAPTGVTFQVADAADLSEFARDEVDVAVCTLMLHHLPAGKAARVLAEMDRVSRRGAYVLDLARIPVVPTLFQASGRMFYDERFVHDGVVSFSRARTLTELSLLARLAGWRDFTLQRRFPAFSVLAGQGFA